MRAFLKTRVWPFAAVFGCVFLVNGVAVTLLFSRGYAFMVSAVGVALGVVFTAALAAACGAVLARTKGLDRDAAGLRIDARAGIELLVATVGAFLCVVALIAALSTAGLGMLRWWRSPSVVSVVLLLVASVVNAAFQQLGLQSLALAARGEGGRGLGASALSLLLFVATHASISQAPVYLLNVALFGGLTMVMFAGTSRRSYAAPSGFHGGWNAALMLLGALPDSGPVAALTWHGGASRWSGGAHGVESGLAYTMALVVVGIVVALVRRVR